MTSKKAFIIRMIVYVLIGFGLPAAYLVYKFKLFEEITTTSVSGWGTVFIIFCAWFMLRMLVQVKKGMKFCLTKQIIDGLCKVTLPLFILTFLMWWMQGFVVEFTEFLIVLTICETLCIPINPLPQWAYNNNIELKEITLDSILRKMYGKKE